MKAYVEVSLPEGVDEEKLRELLEKEGIKIDAFEVLVTPSYEGWDN
jgi:hypothetical protein